jgi:hypothetical protein
VPLFPDNATVSDGSICLAGYSWHLFRRNCLRNRPWPPSQGSLPPFGFCWKGVANAMLPSVKRWGVADAIGCSGWWMSGLGRHSLPTPSLKLAISYSPYTVIRCAISGGGRDIRFLLCPNRGMRAPDASMWPLSKRDIEVERYMPDWIVVAMSLKPDMPKDLRRRVLSLPAHGYATATSPHARPCVQCRARGSTGQASSGSARPARPAGPPIAAIRRRRPREPAAPTARARRSSRTRPRAWSWWAAAYGRTLNCLISR